MMKQRSENYKQMKEDLQQLWRLKEHMTFKAGDLSEQSSYAKAYLIRHATTVWKAAAWRVLFGHGIKKYSYKPTHCRIETTCGQVFELGKETP
jgi:hypothetical protein